MQGNGPLPKSYGNSSRNCSTSQQDMPSPILPSARGDSFLLERDSSGLRAEDPYLLSDGVRMSNDVHRKGKVASCANFHFIPVLRTRCVLVVMLFFGYSRRLTMVDSEEGVDKRILRN